MKDKASQKTEDEVLDQTFAGAQTFDGFDEDMTSQTKDDTKSSSESPKNKKSSSSSNTILFVAAGVAAVGVLSYMFVLKPILNPVQTPGKSQQQEIVPLPPVAPVVPVVPVAPVVPTTNPERQVATDYLLNGNTPVQSTSPVTSIVVPQVVTPVLEVKPTVLAPTLPLVSEISSSNSSSVAIVEELSRKFDTQGQQFRIALDSIGGKVNDAEKFRNDQLLINKNLDERLVKLEGGKVVNTVKKSVKPISVNESNVVKKSNNKTNKYITEDKDPREYRNVLVDKRDVKDVKSKDLKLKDPGVEYNIHSIYGGRLWLKNSDGSLSTYASGDRLPSGELIKSVDDEKYLVNTDRRSFSKK